MKNENNTIKYVTGNMFTDNQPEEGRAVPVIPVNTVGVPGAGLAKQWAIKYPEQAKKYKGFCNQKIFRDPMFIKSGLSPDKDWDTLCMLFPTKGDWRNPSTMKQLKAGLAVLVRRKSMFFNKDDYVAWPKLGCGLGGLKWEEVRPIMLEAIEQFEGTHLIYGEKQ